MRRLFALLSLLLLASAAFAETAPKPLYRDPVYDGAADVSSVYDRAQHRWVMFYTNRRATLKLPDPKDVSWVHGTRIGMATSKNGLKWRYAGVAKFPAACTGPTLWAPELYYEAGTYHMWLTVVPGIYSSWGHGATAKIVHLTSPDLKSWTCSDTVETGSERVIDPSVIKLSDHHYRLWYKDERKGSRIFALDSDDLVHWKKVLTDPVVDANAEGPKVFFFKGYYWLIADKWEGLIVLRSSDAAHWELQPTRILEQPGTHATDNAKGQHADIIVNNDHAFIYYFVHQENAPEAKTDPYWHQRTAVQVAELKFDKGWLSVDRNADVTTPLVAPQ